MRVLATARVNIVFQTSLVQVNCTASRRPRSLTPTRIVQYSNKDPVKGFLHVIKVY